MGPKDMRGEIAVADLKPLWRAILPQHAERFKRISLDPPAKSLLCDTGKRVCDCVEIWAHVQAQKLQIVGRVDDDVELVRRQSAIQTENELRAADSSAERGDHRRSTTSSKE